MSDNCEHKTPLEVSYGFGRASGWIGIGLTYRCPKCSECLWFEDDSECFPEETAHNNAKRSEPHRQKWKEAIDRGEVR